MLAVLSAGLLSASACWGLGNLLMTGSDPHEPRLQRVARCLSIGLLCNLVLVLACPTLTIALAGIVALGLGGLFRAWRQSRSAPSPDRAEPAWPTLLALIVLLFFAIEVLSQPLATWDARSIWFFQARIIALDNGLHPGAGWTSSALAWAHPDYPKLLPALGAEVAALTGYWNEYAPKASLLLLLLPPLALLFARCEASGAWLLLSVSWLFGLGDVLWNGIADGFLALYVAGGALKLSDYARDQRASSLMTGIAFLGVACSLKNEGLLFSLSTLAAFLALRRRQPGSRGFSTADRTGALLVTLFAVAPIFLWSFRKSDWDLHNDLGLGSAASLQRLRGRFVDGHSLLVIVRELASAGFGAWKPACVAAVLVSAQLLLRRFSLPRLIPALSAVFSFGGLCLVYLSTYHDLMWHLGSSAARVMVTVVVLLDTAVASLLWEWDAAEAPDESPRVPAEARSVPHLGSTSD